ncbi:MAG: GLUG motif-containing protein [bacterium]
MTISFNNINSSASLRSLFNSTISLNTTMQRLSTGLRINSAADNAANLGLSKKIDSKISGLNVANNNIQTGVSKLQTLDGYMGGIANNLQRIRDLAVQASNGTYSSAERSMINNEAQAILGEVEQASNQANTDIGADRTNVTGLVNDVTQIAETALPGGYTAIKTATQFKAAIQAGMNSNYMLMNDIDMSELGTVNQAVITGDFTGILDGNGYKIKNLTINSTVANSGLFGRTNGATLKNITLENTTINSSNADVGSLIGLSMNTVIDNCASINCNINGANNTGGLVGEAYLGNNTITSSYASGSIKSTASNTGGLLGNVNSSFGSCSIASSYASGSVAGVSNTGGLVGSFYNGNISSSYSTANVLGSNNNTGGFIGYADYSTNLITTSYSTGNVVGANTHTGGFIGFCSSDNVTNCYASGNVSGNGRVGGFAGYADSTTMSSCYATGNVAGTNATTYAGGFIGESDVGTMTSCYATGNISGVQSVGGFFGNGSSGDVTSCYATGSASGTTRVGGFAGVNGANITSSSSSGKVTGTANLGGFVGMGSSANTNFWNKDSSGQATSAGSAIGKTSAEFDAMTPVTSTWNSSDWDLGFENPVLKAIKNGNINMQTGAEATRNSCYALKDMGLNFGGDLAISLDTLSSAQSAISSIDKVMTYLSSKRSDIGVGINALSGRLTTNLTRKENFTSSSGVLKDTDMAVESAKFTKQQILRNMGMSMLQQSKNMQTNSIQQLLGL